MMNMYKQPSGSPLQSLLDPQTESALRSSFDSGQIDDATYRDRLRRLRQGLPFQQASPVPTGDAERSWELKKAMERDSQKARESALAQAKFDLEVANTEEELKKRNIYRKI